MVKSLLEAISGPKVALLGVVGVLGASAMIAGCEKPKGEVARGAYVYGNCIPCHGDNGNGKADIAAPQIAGLPQYYVENQLAKFKSGQRGLHPNDIAGMRMRPMMLTLENDEDLKAVAAHVAKLQPVDQPLTIYDGNRVLGKDLYATCAACHGQDGRGNEALKSPDLTWQADWYLLTQLKNFKSGVRGAEDGDATGAQMRPMAMGLKDEQAMKDVVSYIQTLRD